MKIKEIRAFEIDLTPRPSTIPREPSRAETIHMNRPISRYAGVAGKSSGTARSAEGRPACIVVAEDGTWGFGISLYPGPVITHGGMNYPYGQHLAMAMPAITWGERSEGVSAPGVPLEEMVKLPGTAVIRDGYVTPSDAPGFGLEIDEAWVESVTV
jgi:hypothetical protein